MGIRKDISGLALQVQEALVRNPRAGDLSCQRSQRRPAQDYLADRLGMSLYSKQLERGRFLWPLAATGRRRSRRRSSVMLDGLDWRKRRHTFRPQRAG